MFKVIFLDVDGVLNCWETTDTCAGYRGLDDDKILRLKKIIDETGAKIVLSSSWRVNRTRDNVYALELREYLDKRLSEHGIKIYSETSFHHSSGEHRGAEIKAWRDAHKNLDYWIVLDDIVFNDFHYYGVIEHLVLTDEWDGLTDDDTKKAIWMLQNCQPYGNRVVDNEEI